MSANSLSSTVNQATKQAIKQVTSVANQITSPVAKSTTNLKICVGGFSCAGLKAENQDAFAAFTPQAFELKAKGAVVALADGVSSASKAAQASQLAVTQFIQEYYATPLTWATKKSAAKVLTSLNQWLYSQSGFIDSLSSADQPQWLTTFSALVLKSTTGYIFHVGDTRISRYRKTQLETITRDHNLKQGRHQAILTRALGADPHLEVDVHQIDLKQGDLYLLTCDGVHDFVANKVIKEQLSSLSSQPTTSELEALSQLLVEKALASGSNDNVTCVLVFIETTPNRQLAEIERDLIAKTIPPVLKVGNKIDSYQVKKILHASIRSHLYLVEHPDHNKLFVLKAPSANFSDDYIYLQGFIREAWVGERIKHGNVMRVINETDESKFLYHICEYIDGQTLSEWMYDNPKPSISVVRNIIEQIISALRSFQRLDLVHRDLKPENIMIDAYGHIKLIDYGTVYVASLDEDHDNIKETVPQGSLNYIAPETLLSLQADYQSDLFSLGVICYQMLSDELPYKPMKRAEVTFSNYSQWQYRFIRSFRPDIPLWLELALQKATEANPVLRYNAYSEFQMDISKPNTCAIANYENQPIIQRNPVQFWQGVSCLLLIAFFIALAT